ncbi:G1/S-specific cyclin-E1-like [Myxocyprinus asiaticus]|uniref:G1/S-specific cyclin-E1-like n=1 Tax=Myxocyprinus asiaticus TaxID=70543 RepID=UPI002223AD3E|nr:G1/S-specific cyclin-E1-like [Myxocyprinus asiaticus]
MPSKNALQTEQISNKDEASKVVSVRPRKRKADVAIHLQDPDEEVIEMTRKKPCASQACWNPDTGYTSPCRRIPTPDEVEEPAAAGSVGFTQYSSEDFFITPTRSTPLPALCWASKDDVWNNLLRKDKIYLRDTQVMKRHPNLQPKMREILLDWLMEVCEVNKLHRETFYLGQDYFDRFMATQENVLKMTLQLIGISCLFIAAKMEEIYPPKVHQFAYVTDGACTEDDILNMEIIIMKELNWSLSPLTSVAWLNIYMQMAYLKENTEVLMAQYPQATFVQIAELLDLCILDVKSLEFSYSLLAASALYHFSSLELVMKVSGLKWCDLEECVKWMVPFAMSIREAGSSALKTFKGIASDDMHNIQTHVPYLEWLGKVHSYQLVDIESSQRSPVPSGVLTPPPSSEKPESTVS